MFSNVDLEPPILTCPQDISVETTRHQDTALLLATWSDPSVTDNSGSIDSIWCSHTRASSFSIGVTRVTYFANDTYGNIGQCHFNIEVKGTRAINISVIAYCTNLLLYKVSYYRYKR